MGGRGGINILGEKSWHVWRMDNRLRVERDERRAREQQENADRQVRQREFRHKVRDLKRKNRAVEGGAASIEDADDASSNDHSEDKGAQGQVGAQQREQIGGASSSSRAFHAGKQVLGTYNPDTRAGRRKEEELLKPRPRMSKSQLQDQKSSLPGISSSFVQKSSSRGGGATSSSTNNAGGRYVNLFQEEEDAWNEAEAARAKKVNMQARGSILSKKGTLQGSVIGEKATANLADFKKGPLPWYMAAGKNSSSSSTTTSILDNKRGPPSISERPPTSALGLEDGTSTKNSTIKLKSITGAAPSSRSIMTLPNELEDDEKPPKKRKRKDESDWVALENNGSNDDSEEEGDEDGRNVKPSKRMKEQRKRKRHRESSSSSDEAEEVTSRKNKKRRKKDQDKKLKKDKSSTAKHSGSLKAAPSSSSSIIPKGIDLSRVKSHKELKAERLYREEQEQRKASRLLVNSGRH
ncbi:unnamed protein product [Amoebophrya sp. A25]|nr:unnamed protein product [Amoebophrya sp. A25]|eukprot:GSA25T00011018001.1